MGLAQSAVAQRRVGLPSTLLLAGKTLGLVGLGRIGQKMVGLARAVGMDVVAVRQTTFPGLAAAQHLAWLGSPEELRHLLSVADVVSLHLPAGAETNGIIGAAEIDTMKKGALLVNTARASLIDYAAALEGIRSGHLGGLGLDVWWNEPVDPEDELLRFDNVIVTPHVAGSAEGARLGVVEVIAENVRRALNGEPVKFQVRPDSDGD